MHQAQCLQAQVLRQPLHGKAIAAGGNVYTTTTGDAVAIAVGDIVNLKSGDGKVVKIRQHYSAGNGHRNIIDKLLCSAFQLSSLNAG